jgi:RNA polymerase sigma factor (sigma-70 family)
VELDDARLMERVKTGDSAAFEQLFKKYELKVLNFLYKLCFSQTLAEDLTQETFLRLWRSRKRFRPEAGKVSTYIFQIAKNCWLSHSQTKKYMARARGVGLDTVAGRLPAADPGGGTEQRELQEKLRAAIAELPDDIRIPFVLSRYEGLKYEEIGQVLDVSARTVEKKVSDAARMLARRVLGK